MDISIFLAKVLGLYLVITSILMLVRPQVLLPMMKELARHRLNIFLVGLITLIIGILLVVSHNLWRLDWRLIITILSWLTLIGGIIRVGFPEVTEKSAAFFLANDRYLKIFEIIFLVLGIFLLYKGFYLSMTLNLMD